MHRGHPIILQRSYRCTSILVYIVLIWFIPNVWQKQVFAIEKQWGWLVAGRITYDIAYNHTKFNDCNFSHSRDITEGVKC